MNVKVMQVYMEMFARYKRHKVVNIALLIGCYVCNVNGVQAQTDKFVLKAGDRVVFLGNTFFERSLNSGHIETALALGFSTANVTFRNIGWSGDTVGGVARTGGRRGAIFGSPQEGFAVLEKHVESLHPTHLFIAYGFNESFGGDNGIAPFKAGLSQLLASVTKTDRQVILISPTPMENGFGPSDQYVAQRNLTIKKYASVIQSTAKSLGHTYIDLLNPLMNGSHAYSSDGIHPSTQGYAKIAKIIAKSLQCSKIKNKLDKKMVNEIRLAIAKKNTLFYHHWRPRNNAYVYGERKEEQRIAQLEPDKITPFIEKQEIVIWQILGELQ